MKRDGNQREEQTFNLFLPKIACAEWVTSWPLRREEETLPPTMLKGNRDWGGGGWAQLLHTDTSLPAQARSCTLFHPHLNLITNILTADFIFSFLEMRKTKPGFNFIPLFSYSEPVLARAGNPIRISTASKLVKRNESGGVLNVVRWHNYLIIIIKKMV